LKNREPTSFKLFRCEPNRKKSKFGRRRLTTITGQALFQGTI
jgi:hypothetical protein